MARHVLSSGVLFIGILAVLGGPNAGWPQDRAEPSLKSFYDVARQVMTEDEAKVFKSLPDDKSRAEFIKEFWSIRDPNPETPENEAEVEFEKRARYAALWFGSHNPYRGTDPGGPLKNLAGVNEDRGRVYVLLGKPDVIIFFDGMHETTSHDGSRSRLRFEQWVLEEWIYDKLRTYAIFKRDDGGLWSLDSFQPNFLDVLEWAKLNWYPSDDPRDVSSWFRFSAAWGAQGLQVVIPVDRVSTDDSFQVDLDIRVSVYRDGAKIDEIRDTRTMKETQENLFEGKNLRFGIPYAPSKKGEYLFDIIITDRKASTPSKYRVLVKESL